MALSLVDELEEDVVDGPADEGAEVEELAVDAMQGGLEEVALSRVLAVEELEELEDKVVVDELFGDVGVEVWALDEAEEVLVDDLEMGPGELEHGLVLFGVEGISGRVDRRGYRAEEVGGKLRSVGDQLRFLAWMERTILTTSGYTVSVITPRWLVMYSSIS